MIAFIILHYKNFEETISCIESIKKIKGNKKIIVVDNNSLLKNEINILKNETDDLICLKKNIGFAKANNNGIKMAKEKYNPDFFFCINNDILLLQKDTIKIIEDTYNKYQFDMLGGKIISPGDSVNPYIPLQTKEKVEKEIKYVKKLIAIYKKTYLYFLLKIYLKTKHFFKKTIKRENGDCLEKNVALHGCGIVFSKKYIEKYKDAFYSKTFLFHEEDFLYQKIIKENLISIYNPKLEIYHKEGSSMSKSYQNERTKKLFREQERLKSLELLLNEGMID